jgi:hypothetical protein
LLFHFRLRQFPQAILAKAIFTRHRHRQSQGFVLAPAIARDIAAELGSACGALELPLRYCFCPICHDSIRKFAAFLMRGSSRTAV